MSIDTQLEDTDDATVAVPTGRTKVWIAVAAVGALAGLAIAWFGVLNRDEKAPYVDPAATGSLTLCDSNGHEVTEGSVAKPIAALVVGSSAASGPFAKTGNASLFAYQPRQGVTAEEFSGTQLTAASAITDPRHPAARISQRSTRLDDFVAGYPAAWDGYVQLRLILTADGSAPQVDHYDTADIRVDGDRWRLVRGGGGDCTSAIQNENANS